MHRLLVLAFALSVALAGESAAQMAVIDVQAIEQLASQIRRLDDQVALQMRQVTALTGLRRIDSWLDTPALATLKGLDGASVDGPVDTAQELVALKQALLQTEQRLTAIASTVSRAKAASDAKQSMDVISESLAEANVLQNDVIRITLWHAALESRQRALAERERVLLIERLSLPASDEP